MNKFNFHHIKLQIAQTKRELPVLLANQAQNYFTETFTKGGIGDEKWKEVNRRTPDTNEYKYPKFKGLQRRTSPILSGAGWRIRGGELRRRVARSIVNAQWQQIRLVVDLPYAEIHNKGGQAGRNHATTIPARPFIKQTRELGVMQERTIKKTMDKIWS
jgi:phage gpG-like protein